MLNEGYFEDSFILQDPTNHYFHIVDMIDHAKKSKSEEAKNDEEANLSDEESVSMIHRLEADDGK